MPLASKDSFPGKHDAGAKQAERGTGPILLSFGITARVLSLLSSIRFVPCLDFPPFHVCKSFRRRRPRGGNAARIAPNAAERRMDEATLRFAKRLPHLFASSILCDF